MLTDEQRAKRRGKLTASRIAVLMTGDAEGIMRLYEEMIGVREEEDLSDNWAVQLGSCTEALNLDWYERRINLVVNRGLVVAPAGTQWACTIDGWDSVLDCPVETKHTGGYEPVEIVIDRYQPQMQWQMYVTGLHYGRRITQCALSVIMGAQEPRIEYIDRDDGYIEEMVRRAQHFMMCVDLEMPPIALAPVPPPIDPKVVYDMQGNNEWASNAAIWLDNVEAGKKADEAKKLIKELVPQDAARAFGYGVIVSRNKAGNLSLRKDKS